MLAELAEINPELYPPLAPVSPPPKPANLAALTTVDKIKSLANPTSPEAVKLVVKAVVDELNDYHSTGWHNQLWQSVAAGELSANTMARLFTEAKRAPKPSQHFGRAVKGLRGLSEKTDGQAYRQATLPIGPKTFPAPV
jgi:hypothetical protein